ncbi:MAG: DUF4258 domain-containing protein [Desulfobacterales bacterium]|jgi:hypothetical protein|nr:DUF4258 domain-containing protein [Desulfobacterales bacterium]
MVVHIHPHAKERMEERGASEDEITATIEKGERYPAKYGRIGFRRNFVFNEIRRGKFYATKQVELYAVQEQDRWLVITVLTRFF